MSVVCSGGAADIDDLCSSADGWSGEVGGGLSGQEGQRKRVTG